MSIPTGPPSNFSMMVRSTRWSESSRPNGVDLQAGQRVPGDLAGDDVVRHHLGVVADALEQPVCHPRRAASAVGDLSQSVVLRVDGENPRRPVDDLVHVRHRVEVEPVDDSETVPQRRADHTVAGRRSDERERLDGEVHAPRLQALVDDPRDEEVLHGGIEYLLDDSAQAVDFVDEQDVVFLKLGQDGHHVARALDGRAGGGLDPDAHLDGHDVGQRRLAQAGRAVEQRVVERLAPLLGGDDAYVEVGLQPLLADVVLEAAGPQAPVQCVVVHMWLARDDAFVQLHARLSTWGTAPPALEPVFILWTLQGGVNTPLRPVGDGEELRGGRAHPAL